MSWLNIHNNGVMIEIHATPKSSMTKIIGEHGDRLKIKLTAAPENGAANKELIDLIAQKLDVYHSSVQIAYGHTSRMKSVFVDGVTVDDVTKGLLPD